MYWTFGVSVAACFLLSYPPTEYIVQGIRGPMSFRLETGLVAFTVIVFVLGFFMSLGKAAVFKHIPVYYPKHVGSVGGVVGLVGGLGGFVLPILFGVLNDLTGVWQSCFMALFAISRVALVWMHLADPSHGEGRLWRGAQEAPRASRDAGNSRAQTRRRARSASDRGLAAGGQGVLGDEGPRDCPPQPVHLHPRAAALVRRVDGMVGGGRQAAFDRLYLHDRPIVLARRTAWTIGRDAPHLLLLHGADLRRPAVDHADHLVADHSGARHRHGGAEPGDTLLAVPRLGAAVRVRRRQLRLLDVEHLLLLPEGGEGQRAGPQCRPWQPRRQRRAVRRAARHHRRRVRLARRRAAYGQARQRREARCGCRTPATSGCRSSSPARSRPGSA